MPFTVGRTWDDGSRDEAEAQGVLLKGGFLWVDDFWGTEAWDHWTRQLSAVLPPTEFPVQDVPLDDPIFKSQFTVTKIPQITNIAFWRSTRGSDTSERGSDSVDPHFLLVIRDVTDDHGGDDAQHRRGRFLGTGR